ncbi:hypothetical protein [Geomonas azotofigens]|uniref:hypothetical protein n=1 Tax=Geomonas azotofigens TaxID=2843196 RepID=UPI001C11681A|nr:hypothetical protein [Geomonas azotofigens]MBU5613697.1 hypothetical protein [Geomonas azotofigens]
MDRHEVEGAAVAAETAEASKPAGASSTGEGEETVAAMDPAVIASGLAAVRKRRWCLWIVLIVYLPTMYLTQKITHSFSGSMPVFFAWFAVLLCVMFYSATARCPRCRNYYHMQGMALLYLRRCLHCQLPLDADKRGKL